MNKTLIFFCCLIVASINANYILLNKTRDYVLFTEIARAHSYTTTDYNTTTNYILEPGAAITVTPAENLAKKSILSAQFLIGIDKNFMEWFHNLRTRKFVNYYPEQLNGRYSNATDKFFIPDDAYAEILLKARDYLPTIVINTKQRVGCSAVISVPQTTQDLQKEMDQIKKEKIAAATKEVSKATNLPTQQGGVSGIVAEYYAEQD